MRGGVEGGSGGHWPSDGIQSGGVAGRDDLRKIEGNSRN